MKYHMNSCPSEWLMGDTALTTHWKGGLLPPYRSCKEALTEILHVLVEVLRPVMGLSSFLSSDTKLH